MTVRLPWRNLAFVTAVVMVAALLTAMSAAPAKAQSLEPLCESGQVCMFKAAGYAGGIAAYRLNDTNYNNNTFDHCSLFCGLNDSTSSVDNDGVSCSTRHYNAANWGGGSFLLPRGNARANLAGTAYQDELSSHRWVNCT